MTVLDYLQEHILLLDGGMGTMLQAAGMQSGERSEAWNLSRPEAVRGVHRAYFDAGSNVVNANTFGALPLLYGEKELEELVAAAMENARAAREESTGSQPKWVALDIGPTGQLLQPFGSLAFADAVAAFAALVRLGVKHGAELICIETMNDCYETKAALLAAKEQSGLPVFVTNAYGAGGRLMTGADPAAMTALLEGMGADAVGVNCSLGPKALRGVVEEYLRRASVPVILKPNAGLPRVEAGTTVYDVPPEEFAFDVAEMVRAGVRICGGCCGTTPDFIRALRSALPDRPVPLRDKGLTVISSSKQAVTFGGAEAPVLIGDRMDPRRDEDVREALLEDELEDLLDLADEQEEDGAQVLRVSAALPELDEPSVLARMAAQLQTATALPLQFDSADPAAMERALRCYNGKALLSAVSGAQASMDAFFPLLKKYGGVALVLAEDENGVPPTAEGRVESAKKILREAEKYGVAKKDLIFTVPGASDAAAAQDALRAIERELGCKTALCMGRI